MIQQTLNNLNKNGFIASMATSENIQSKVEEILKTQDLVGVGGSQTLSELGLLTNLKNNGYNILSVGTCDLDWETICSKSRMADIYLTSSNAISSEGYLINIDGRGNRVANMIYGVSTVIVIAGTNKVVKTLNDGLDRASNVAAPLNAIRLKRNTPCTKTLKCMDCNSDDRICSSYVIHKRPNSKTKTYVFLIDNKLGY